MNFHVIGDHDTLVGYRFSGIGGEAAETPDEARDAFRRAIARRDVAVLLVTEPLSVYLEAEITAQRLAGRPPYVVLVGDWRGTKVRRKSLDLMIYEAVGIRMVSEEDRAGND
jgi:vacuolar-type H+-ATPase subunit F/Vma7